MDPRQERDGTQCLRPCLPTMFSRDVTTVEPEIKHTVVAVSFYCFCYNCSRAAKLYREGGAEYAADGKKLKKKKKYILQINLRARNGPLGRLSNHSELESLRHFDDV